MARVIPHDQITVGSYLWSRVAETAPREVLVIGFSQGNVVGIVPVQPEDEGAVPLPFTAGVDVPVSAVTHGMYIELDEEEDLRDAPKTRWPAKRSAFFNETESRDGGVYDVGKIARDMQAKGLIDREPGDDRFVIGTPTSVTQDDFNKFLTAFEKQTKQQQEQMAAMQKQQLAMQKAMVKSKKQPVEVSDESGVESDDGIDALERRLDGYADKAGDRVNAGPRKVTTVDTPGVKPVKEGAVKVTTVKETNVNTHLSRLEYMTRSPVALVLKHGRAARERDDWPFGGTAVEDRLATGYFAQVYRGGRRGVDYARDFMQKHGCNDCKLVGQLVLLLSIADEALMYDDVNICDTASMEIIARRCYGIERAFELCTKPDHWKSRDEKANRVQMNLLSKFDVVENLSGGYRDAAAESRAMKELATEATLNKHLKGTAGTAVPEVH